MMGPAPYWTSPDGDVQLYLGDMREVLPELGQQADLVVADPPFEETKHAWDRWPNGWLQAAAAHSSSLWCFGSQRMFFDHLPEFRADWKLSQDIVGNDISAAWSKPVATSLVTDRFRRSHEQVLLWYRGPWADQHHVVPRVLHAGPNNGRRAKGGRGNGHNGAAGQRAYADDGTRLMLSVIPAPSVPRGERIHESEKPVDLLIPLITYACPPGGLVLDPFAGSGSTLDAARQSGRRAVGVEVSEAYCEAAARRLDQLALFGPTPA